MRETIRDWTGCILGYVDTESNGDKTVRAFSGVILGYYRKSRDVTTDFYGRVLTKGDTAVSLIYSQNNK